MNLERRVLYEQKWPLGRDDQENHCQQQVQLCTRHSMSRSDKDGLELQCSAKEMLNDPIGKANHIVTLLKAVHTSKPKVTRSPARSSSAFSQQQHV